LHCPYNYFALSVAVPLQPQQLEFLAHCPHYVPPLCSYSLHSDSSTLPLTYLYSASHDAWSSHRSIWTPCSLLPSRLEFMSLHCAAIPSQTTLTLSQHTNTSKLSPSPSFDFPPRRRYPPHLLLHAPLLPFPHFSDFLSEFPSP